MRRWRCGLAVLIMCLLGGCRALAAPQPLSVMVYDRGNMDFSYGTCVDNAWTQYLRQAVLTQLNIEVEYVAVSRANDVSQLSMMLAAGTAPDIVFTYDYDLWTRFCDAGLTADLTQALEEYGGNIRHYLGDVQAYGVYEGVQRAVLNKRASTEVTSSFVRKDWLDRLGISLRKDANGGYVVTTTELYQILQAFKAADFAGVGQDKALGMISYGTTYWPILLILEAFYEREAISEEDLFALPFFLLSGAKDGYRYMNMLYNNGLLNADFAVIGDADKSRYIETITTGRAGFWINDAWFGFGSEQALSTLMQNDPQAQVVAVDILGPKGENAYKYTYNDYGMILFVPAGSERLETAMQYLNYLAVPENDFVLRFGFEGEHYEMVDALPTVIDAAYNDRTRVSVSDLAILYNGCAYWKESLDGRLQTQMLPANQRALRLQANRVATTNSFQVPVISSYIPETSQYADILETRERELRVRTIMCPESEFSATWDACVQAYLQAGGQTVIDRRREAYAQATVKSE